MDPALDALQARIRTAAAARHAAAHPRRRHQGLLRRRRSRRHPRHAGLRRHRRLRADRARDHRARRHVAGGDRERDARARPDARVRAAALRRGRHARRRGRGRPVRAAPALRRRGARLRARRAGARRHRRGPVVRRPRHEERRRLRRVAPDDRRARHARRHHRGLAQVPAAAAGRGDARASSARPTRRSAWPTNGAASRCRCRRRASTTAACACACPARSPRSLRRWRKLGGAARRRRGRVLDERARPHASRSSRPRRSGDEPLWRLSVQVDGALHRPGRRPADRVGRRAALARRRASAPIRARCARGPPRSGGHATLFRAADKTAGAFQPLDADDRGAPRGSRPRSIRTASSIAAGSVRTCEA